jgi:hypothetical protein
MNQGRKDIARPGAEPRILVVAAQTSHAPLVAAAAALRALRGARFVRIRRRLV